jgi:hypothetical protein
MSEIHQSTTVDVPFTSVPALLKRFVSSLPQSTNGEAIVNLHATIGDVGIERDAIIKIVPARRYPGIEVLEVSWHPREDGPFPTFKGTLCAEQEDVTFCRLDLDGGYVPPGGIVGLAFDELLGHRIAKEVVRELLDTFKSALEESNA